MASASGITFERLPPERENVAVSAASAGSCCCCCCCCLHTVGSLLGALTAMPPEAPVETVPTAIVGTPKSEPKYKVTREYWLTLFLVCAIAFPTLLLVRGYVVDESLEWLLWYALFLPLMQLATSIIVAFMTYSSKRPGREQRIRHLVKITLRAFIGGLIGIGIMLLIAVAR
ncbi:MAG: hypothetical protein M3619_22775 [Myxococcota bacterium]|nr:hypothetical protein [Myxococcota bacterium]